MSNEVSNVPLSHGLVDEGGRPLSSQVNPPLTEHQEKKSESRTSISPLVVHQTIRKNGEEELLRPTSALAWSGLAAGLSMGFSFIAEALLYAALPNATWRPLIVAMGYPVGFWIVIMGRQQLFTENTLTPVIPLLSRRTLSAFFSVLRLWATVLVANLTGVHALAWVLANTNVMQPPVREAMRQIAMDAAAVSPGDAILRGIFAGWLIALIVWMLAAMASESARIVIIGALTYVVGLAGLAHVIIGSAEVLFLVMLGTKSWLSYLTGYMAPTLLGNIIGGVSLVSALNHAQVMAGRVIPPAPKGDRKIETVPVPAEATPVEETPL